MTDDLDSLRECLSRIDDEIVGLLGRRFELTDEIGRIKKAKNVPIENKAVEDKILKRLTVESCGKVDPHFLVKTYCMIFEESKRRQKVVS